MLGSVPPEPRAGSAAGQGPRIQFAETTHDFGQMRGDEKRSHRWVFRNVGDAPLIVLDTRSSCGCTASVAEESEIPPGGSGVLLVTFDASGQYGTVRKTVVVTTNDPVQPRVRLTIKAEVARPPDPEGPGGHPPILGRSLLAGTCANCHARPAGQLQDEALYAAVCAMCHGPRGLGVAGKGPSLRAPDYLLTRSDDELAQAIAFGTANPAMPGFSEVMGGPLKEAQIRSLVNLLRRWGPAGEGPAAATGED